MDGKSVYGAPIKDRRSVVRRKNFSVEIIYSGIYSDMPLVYQEKGNAVLRFYKELVNQCSHWVYAHRVRKEKVTILMSNCMYSKTGYCGRKGKNEIRLYAYIGNKKFTEISFSRKDIIHPGRYQGLARKAVNKILSAKR
jgi:hypothetical protein